jgi:spore maturation protein CgeB
VFKDKFERVNLYNDYESNTLEKLIVHEQADYYTEVPIIARRSKINLVIANRNWQTAIPPISWDIMAAGGFTISTIQNDYNEIFKDTIPIMYEDKYDLFNKAKYYIKNENERERIAKELSEEVRDKHTYETRISELFDKILN